MRVHALLNPAAGPRSGSARDAVAAAFAAVAPGVELTIEEPRDPAELARLARLAVAARPDAIAAGGGDGTVNAVAGVVAGSGVPLAVLPLGTLNHFAKDLGIPLALEEAVRVVCEGETRAVDLAEVNGRPFLNTSSVGVYADVVRFRERWRGWLGKWPAMLLGLLVVMRRYPLLRLDLELGGERTRRFVPLLFVGNNAYSMTWPDTGSRARLDEGCLTLVLLRDSGVPALWRSTYHLFRGATHLAPDIEIRCVETLSVRTRERMRVAIDGEVVRLEPPLVYRSRPGALLVRVPGPPAASPPGQDAASIG